MNKSAQKKKKLIHSYKSNKKSWVITFFLSIFFLISSLSPIYSVPSQVNIDLLGSGPLQGESGQPVAVQMLDHNSIIVFDALKLAVIKLNLDGSFIDAFSVAEYVEKKFDNFMFRASMDGYIFLQIQDQLLIFNKSGSLVNNISLHTLQAYNPGNSFVLPINKQNLLLFNKISQQYSIVNPHEPHSSRMLTFDSTGFGFIDFFCSSEHIYLLGSLTRVGRSETYNIIVLDHGGDFVKNIAISPDIILAPQRLSVAPDHHIVLLNNQFQYVITDSNSKVLSNGTIESEYHPYLSFNFCSMNRDSFLVPNLKKGLMKFTNDSFDKLLLPVVSEGYQLLGADSIAANKQFIITFDSISERFLVFQDKKLLRSFFIHDLPLTQNRINDVRLYASKDWLYIAVTNNKLHIFKYNPLDGQIHNIRLPEYISPRSYVYVRSEDSQIFIYSWFDSILYSFAEGDSIPKKTQVKRHESAISSQDSICKIDSSGNIFILLPSISRMNVYREDGSLEFSFYICKESCQISDFHFLDDFLILLNKGKGVIHIQSKKGEELNQLGHQKSILYPKEPEGYHEDIGLFFRPRSLFCFDGSIYVVDTGNSRIQIIRYFSSSQKTVIELQIGSPSAYIDGERISLDAPPFIESGRTLVPLRFIGEAFGAQVEWFAEDRRAKISLGPNVIEVTIGETTAMINGEAHFLDVPALIRQGRTFVPLRFIGEAFGASIVWEAESKRVIITYPGY